MALALSRRQGHILGHAVTLATGWRASLVLAVAMGEWPDNVVVFDGMCNLCTWSVSFIISHDKHALFRFASIQSPAGRQLCQGSGIDPDTFNSILLLQRTGARRSSDAALAIATAFGGPWRLLAVLRIVPRPVRDWVYGSVARHRYRWFGRQAACLVPSAEIRHRFIE
jgi:predicted DCC family thiol-disulfide oxidoreductase YuxK